MIAFCQMFYDFVMYKDEEIQREVDKALTKFVPWIFKRVLAYTYMNINSFLYTVLQYIVWTSEKPL